MTDIAANVMQYQPISLTMGYVNVIWQRDANRIALELFEHVSSPPVIVNVTGTERLSVRDLAEEFGRRFEAEVTFEGAESDTALLSNTARMQSLLVPPEMKTSGMIDLVANWIIEGGPLLDKPTHFETRDGGY